MGAAEKGIVRIQACLRLRYRPYSSAGRDRFDDPLDHVVFT
jgi:hypothetical protein